MMRRGFTIAPLVLVISILAPTAAAAERIRPLALPVEPAAKGFEKPVGVVVDQAGGAIFVSDRKAGTVTRVAPDGSKTPILTGLKKPMGVALDGDGRLLIAEEGRDRLLRLEPSGTLTVLASGMRDPRWIAVGDDGALYVSADGLRRHDDDDDEDDGDEDEDTDDEDEDTDDEDEDEDGDENEGEGHRRGEAILRLGADGVLTVFADGFEGLEGVAVRGAAVYAVTERLLSERKRQGTTLVRIPITADGTAGPLEVLVRGDVHDPVGLAIDRLGAVFFTAERRRGEGHPGEKGLILKRQPDGRLVTFATGLKDHAGLAFQATGHLLAAERSDDEGRVLRFRAPSPPVFSVPAFTHQSPFPVTGTTAPTLNGRVDLFVNGAATAVTGLSDASGAFSLLVPLTPNAPNTVEGFATAHAGDGLTSPPAEGTITHDATAPVVSFQAPAANAFVRRTVTVQAQATDPGAGVASLTLSAGPQPLSATLSPTPPAISVTATASWDTTPFADGAHTLTATATDQAGGRVSATQGVIVDNAPPETEITGGPRGEVNEPTATFTFTGADNLTVQASLVFAGRLDGGDFTPFSSETTASFTGLAEGTHTFEVKARDLAGNEDPTPAVRTFTLRLGPSITAVDPASGPIGTLVTITGTNFQPGATQVTFNGVAAVLRTVSPTSITTTVPVGATTGLLVVTTTGGTASRTFTVTATGDFTLTVAPAPPATARVVAGDQTSLSLVAGGTGSFTSLVSLSVSTPPAGVTTGFSPQLVAPGGTSFLTLAVAGTVATGTYQFTVSGQAQVDGQTLTRSAAFALEVFAPDTHAVTGRVLTAEVVPQPIPGVTVALGTAFTLTDAAGNFVLLSPPTGAAMLIVDGRTASTADAQYPLVEIQVNPSASGPTRVPFILYLPKIDTAHPINLPLDATGAVTQTVQATTPRLPGLVVTIPQGTRIIGPDGNPVRQLTITPVPIDRSPMPFPPGISPPLLFAIQPGGAVPSTPLPITFPNVRQDPPGTRSDLYYFDLVAGNWNIWGQGTVTDDSTQIVSNPGAGLPRLAWHFPACTCAGDEPGGGHHGQGGDPVDLVTGRLTITKTDLVLPGRLPVTIQRSYRSGSPTNGLLGIGWTLGPYDSQLLAVGTSLRLTQPDQSSTLFTPAGPGQWTNTTEPAFFGAVLTQLPGDFVFQLRFKDGTLHRFERIFGFANLAALSQITDRNSNTVTLTREQVRERNKITRITEPAGRSLTLQYDGAHRILAITDPIGRIVKYDYDAQGRLISVTDPAGGITRYAYDTANRIVSITDPRAITFITNEYDAAGRVVRQTQADGGVWTFAYTLAGATVTQTVVTDPRGNPTTHRFNSQGFTVSQTDALGQTTAFEYAPGSNLLVATTDPLGRTMRFTHDARGNIASITDSAGHRRTFTYEPTFNKVASITDPLGNVTRFEYDLKGNPTAAVDPLGNRITLAYNASGQPISITDPLGNTTTFAYDAQGNLAGVADPLGNTTTREYDAASRLTRQLDPLGKPTILSYDLLSRVTSLRDALGGVTRFRYDDNGNLLTVTDARGSVTTYTYDTMDRLATRTDPVGATESSAYDPVGNLIRHSDRKAQVSTFTYDGLNRRVGASYADGSTTGFAYDAAGRLVQTSDSMGGTILNQYDVLDRLIAQGTGLGTVSYQYDALGRRTRMDAPGQPPVTYGYDAASRLTAITQASQLVSLAYDMAGRRTRLALPNGVSTEYQYDAASRLTALIYRNALGPLGDLNYQYDGAGNRASLSGSFARTLMPDPVASATYDAANRQTTFGPLALTYDRNGNLTGDGTTTYTWDARNRLTALATPSATASFAYDPQDRRLAKTVNGATTRYLYDGLDIVTELTDLLAVPYLRTLGIDEALGRGASEFYLADALGSTLALTSQDATVTTAYTYAPFGITVADSPADLNPFQFTGQQNDSTGLYYYRARYYRPGLQRFISEDPIGLLAGDPNLYAYAGNNPLRFTDPLGLDKADPNQPEFDSLAPEMQLAGFNPALICVRFPQLCQRIAQWIERLATRVPQTVHTGSKIEVTAERLAHVIARHTPGGAESAGKSVFYASENISSLIRTAERVTGTQQSGGNFQRIVDAGRAIGINRATGQATNLYTVITSSRGQLITAFPGLP
jgi:RHS repeat-associated protein